MYLNLNQKSLCDRSEHMPMVPFSDLYVKMGTPFSVCILV